MFGTKVQEFCTGTGDDITLTGNTVGALTVASQFSDGDLFAYFIEDSGGTINVAGVGTYVSASTKIVRNDTWNNTESNPSSNVTLSGGTHTIRCTAIGQNQGTQFRDGVSGTRYFLPDNLYYDAANCQGGGQFSPVIGRLVLTTARFNNPTRVSDIGIYIATAFVGGNARIGLYSCKLDGTPNNLIVDSGNIATDAAGVAFGGLASSIIIPAGDFIVADFTDNTTVQAYGAKASATNNIRGSRLGLETSNTPDATEAKSYYDLSFGAMPATLGTPDGFITFGSIGAIFR